METFFSFLDRVEQSLKWICMSLVIGLTIIAAGTSGRSGASAPSAALGSTSAAFFATTGFGTEVPGRPSRERSPRSWR